MEIAVIVLLVVAMAMTIVRILRKKEGRAMGLAAVISLGFATIMIILRRFGA